MSRNSCDVGTGAMSFQVVFMAAECLERVICGSEVDGEQRKSLWSPRRNFLQPCGRVAIDKEVPGLGVAYSKSRGQA